jgi:glycosyltransferase involved in cell wall biosynthesis
VKILVATDQWFPDRMGGVARLATDTARGLAERGHEVVVVAPRRGGGDEISEDVGLTLLRVLPRGRLPQTATDPRATRRWARQLSDRDFDVLVAHSATSAAGLLGARLDVPLVYVFHADAAAEARYLRGHVRPGRDWLAALVFEGRLRRLTTDALERASAVVVLSEFSRGLVGALAPNGAARATVVPGMVDTNAFTPEGREEARRRLGVDSERVLFTVRRLEPRMGLENLLGAAALLDDVPGLRLVVAASGSGLDLPSLRTRLGLDASVVLLGRVAEAELKLWYRAADLFVLPTVAYEGFGLATAEALASGTPVVGTNVGATPELLEPLEPRLVVRGTDPRMLAEAIRTGLELGTPALRERCRAYTLERLSLDAVLPQWERVLEDASTRRGEQPLSDLRRRPVRAR